ncbi:hypothetical protein PV326_013564 [Microctonus aethiopoides]|nr:hypothetical protein PV326_013564 [Microctonus aethiopoides]
MMALLALLTLSLVTISTSRSTNKDLLERAAAQLNRLSTFRKTQQEKLKITTKKLPEISEIILNGNNINMSNQSNQKMLINTDTMRRIDELATLAYQIAKDSNYSSTMQERIKRSGSGDFITGIAGKVINGVVGASGGLSSGLSGGSSGPQAHDSYGAPVQPYGQPSFSIWDFKKAIINTLVQALKALAGGAIAVKGHLIKGGGFIVQTTGRLISSAGEAASSLGTQIASNAVISQPKPAYGAPGYSYDAPQHQDYSYDGPPPSAEGTYSQQSVHHHYGVPSDVLNGKVSNPANEPGVLVIKPMINEDHQQNHLNDNHLNDNAQHSQPSLSALEESFGGIPKKNTKTITKLVGLVTGTSGTPQAIQHNEHVDYNPAEHKDQPPSSSLNHQHLDSQHAHNHPSPSSSDYSHAYQHDQQQNQPGHDPQQFSQENSHEIPINQDYQLAYQHIQSLINPYLRLPINEAQSFIGETPNYGFDSSFESLKIPIINQQYQSTFEIGNYGLPNGYGIPMHHGIGISSVYPNLKRSSFILPQSKKIKSRNIVVKKAVDFRIKDSMLYSI